MRTTIGPKQFLEVEGKAILIYTLERFEEHEKIDGIYLVVVKSREAYTRELIEKFGIKKLKALVAVEDEEAVTAHHSILNGIMAMKTDGISDEDIVLIHDGVRPIIDDHTITNCIRVANKYGNAITALPAQETIAYKADEDTIGEVTVRDEMIILQAPQAFRFETAYDVNIKALDDGIVGTVVDQAELNRHYGNELHFIEGLKGNVKITVPLDFTYFEFLVKSKKYKLAIKGEVVV